MKHFYDAMGEPRELNLRNNYDEYDAPDSIVKL